MAFIREETIQNYSDSELLRLVRETLEEMGLPYEEKPGGFGLGKLTAPGGARPEEPRMDWTEVHTRTAPAVPGFLYSPVNMQIDSCGMLPNDYRLTKHCRIAAAA